MFEGRDKIFNKQFEQSFWRVGKLMAIYSKREPTFLIKILNNKIVDMHMFEETKFSTNNLNNNFDV
jgi:hypothetical protein